MRDNFGRFVAGHTVSQEWKDSYREKTLGLARHTIPHTEESKALISKNRKGLTARENNPNWKGGTYIKSRYFDSYDIKSWRNKIFQRDDYTCQVCKQIGCELNAHHIKNWNEYEDLRFEITNGITLCIKCHNKTKKKEKQFEWMFNTINTYNSMEEQMKYNIEGWLKL